MLKFHQDAARFTWKGSPALPVSSCVSRTNRAEELPELNFRSVSFPCLATVWAPAGSGAIRVFGTRRWETYGSFPSLYRNNMDLFPSHSFCNFADAKGHVARRAIGGFH